MKADEGPEVTVQLATRISLEVEAVLASAYARTGKKKRALVEEAILATWSTRQPVDEDPEPTGDGPTSPVSQDPPQSR